MIFNLCKKFILKAVNCLLILTVISSGNFLFAMEKKDILNNNYFLQKYMDIPQKGIDWDYDTASETLIIKNNVAMQDYSEAATSYDDSSDDRPWKEFKFIAKKIKIKNNVTGISNGSFCNFYKVTDVEFETNCKIESIGKYAFQNCINLTKIFIPGTVTLINECAFFGCLNLIDVIFEKESKLKKVNMYAFACCVKLNVEKIHIFNKLNVDNIAFIGCLHKGNQQNNDLKNEKKEINKLKKFFKYIIFGTIFTAITYMIYSFVYYK